MGCEVFSSLYVQCKLNGYVDATQTRRTDVYSFIMMLNA